ncbi:MAG: methyl-accepting chemotaxis protein [Methanolobus sp.]
MNIERKLIAIMLALSLIPLLLVSAISYSQASVALQEDAFEKLTAIKAIKTNQIEDYFDQKKSEVYIFSEDPAVVESLPLFAEAFKGGTGSAEWKALDAEYSPLMEDLITEFGYYDLFLIDTEGNIVYTVAKEADLGTNLVNGQYSNSNLASAYKLGNSEISYVDMEMYEPSDEPAMFIAGPVHDENGNKIGVLAFQMSVEAIDAIMNERSGLGETGETYLVGEDKLMRSDSRFEQDATILVKEIDTLGVTEGLAGKDDTKIFDDYRGVSVLSSYTLIEFDHFNWVLLAEIDESEAMATVTTLGYVYISSILIFGIIVSVVAYYFSRTITSPIKYIVGVTEKIADGDLTVEIENNSNDEIGHLTDSVRKMLGSLKELIGDIRTSSSLLASTAEEISASSEEISAATTEISNTVVEVSKGATVQSSKAEETAKIMFDLTEAVQEVASISQRAADDAAHCNDIIGSLGMITEDLLGKMGNIKMATSDSAEAIMDLDSKSKQIGEIVSLITNIADQTNLLALNAAIEAARAGEHGRGFAVVADEVRKLAENSGNAASQIEDLIHEIQSGTNNTVESMQHGTEEVSNGSEALNEAASVIDKVVESGISIGKMVQDIAAAAQEQAASIQEISSSIDEVATISHESASSTENTTAAIEEQTATMQELAQSAQVLSGMAENLMTTISRFKIDETRKAETIIPEYTTNIQPPDFLDDDFDLEADRAESIIV